MNGVQTRFKCKLDVKRCKRFVFPPSSLLPRSNALKTKAIRYFQTDRTLTRIVSPPLNKDHYPAQKTPYLHGAAMLLKKTIIDKLSLMPEEYFLYYEELDWCTYINREGYELWYDPACEIWHKDSSSTGKESPLKYYYLSRNRLLYAYRNLFDWKLPVSILYQTMIVCPKNILTALGKGKKAIAKAHWEGTKAFFKLRNKDKQP